ncbi:MAG: glutamine--tRNA ligase, partial [Bacteroidales bacterium]|nr:glutamine--tRNA ligase [Bacteroidales bacterium]
ENLNEETKEKDFLELLNPNSLIINTQARVEPFLKNAKAMENYQFQRIGYFNVDTDSTAEKLVFNRTAGLKDTWAKEMKK